MIKKAIVCETVFRRLRKKMDTVMLLNLMVLYGE